MGVKTLFIKPGSPWEKSSRLLWRFNTIAMVNGADVTGGFDVASNGAIGDVVMLVDGENRVEVSVFGEAWWNRRRLVEHRVELRIQVERPIDRWWG